MLSVLSAAQAARTGYGWIVWIKDKTKSAYELMKRGQKKTSIRTHEVWYWIEKESQDAFPLVVAPNTV